MKAIATKPGEETKYMELSNNEKNARKVKEDAYKIEKERYEREDAYKEKRAAEYNPIGDQLDAIWKQMNQDRLNGKELIQDADSQLNYFLAVKKRNPKPV